MSKANDLLRSLNGDTNSSKRTTIMNPLETSIHDKRMQFVPEHIDNPSGDISITLSKIDWNAMIEMLRLTKSSLCIKYAELLESALGAQVLPNSDEALIRKAELLSKTQLNSNTSNDSMSLFKSTMKAVVEESLDSGRGKIEGGAPVSGPPNDAGVRDFDPCGGQ